MATTTALTGADQAVATSLGHYFGFSIRETASAAATVRIYDDPDSANGTLLDSIQLAAGESAREWYGPQGIQHSHGIYVDIVSGTVEGSIRHG